jgi:hypothetical protein
MRGSLREAGWLCALLRGVGDPRGFLKIDRAREKRLTEDERGNAGIAKTAPEAAAANANTIPRMFEETLCARMYCSRTRVVRWTASALVTMHAMLISYSSCN